MRNFCLAILALCLHACASGPGQTVAKGDSENVIVQWNALILELAEKEDGFLTLKGLRAVTLAHLAMVDALNAVDVASPDRELTSVEEYRQRVAAVNDAGYEVALSQYPNMDAELSKLRSYWQQRSAHNKKDSDGGAVGRDSALAVLLARKDDGWDTPSSYRFHPMGPGVYAEFNEHSGTPEGFVFGAGWARAKGFALSSPSQFRVPAPPAIQSKAYTVAFNEVKEKGRFQSYTRTPDQTHLALWWKDFVENSHNRLARRLVHDENLGLRETARLFALLNMSIFDAYVSSFDNKYHFNHWRPFTAIRWAANDGNAATKAEETWTNTHRHTYPFPSYPSAHGTACAAAMTALESIFGENYPFEMRTAVVDVAGPFSGKIRMSPETRQFPDFVSAAKECAASRVYLGIHFRYDSDAGFALGRQVGLQVLNKFAN